MGNAWVTNGILIQNLHCSSLQSNSSYYGIGRYESWPLAEVNDSLAKLLTEEAENNWFGYFYKKSHFALAVSPSRNYVQRYLKACKEHEIETRLLLIETQREVPRWDGVSPPTSLFLGYDYATSQDFFSILFDDLFVNTKDDWSAEHKSKLNSYGLFSQESDLETYIRARNEAVSKGVELESYGDFCKYRLYLINSLI